MVLQTQVMRLGPQRLRVSKGEAVYRQGDEDGYWFQVMEGVIRTCRISSDGCRHLTSFCYPGDVFGIELGPHGDEAEAVISAEVFAWRGWEAPGGAPLTPESALYRSLSTARRVMCILGRRTAEERVAAFLIAANDRACAARVNLPMTRADIADHLGLTPYTVSRTFSEFVRRGLIEMDDAQNLTMVQVQLLREMAGES